MRKRHHAVGIAGIAAAALIGGLLARHEVGRSAAPCEAPKTLTQTDYNGLTVATDHYVEENFNKQDYAWAVEDAAVEPTKATAYIAIGPSIHPAQPGLVNPAASNIYKIVLVRDCVNGDWTVQSFAKQGSG